MAWPLGRNVIVAWYPGKLQAIVIPSSQEKERQQTHFRSSSLVFPKVSFLTGLGWAASFILFVQQFAIWCIKREMGGQWPVIIQCSLKEQSPVSSSALWWYWEFPGICFSYLQLPIHLPDTRPSHLPPPILPTSAFLPTHLLVLCVVSLQHRGVSPSGIPALIPLHICCRKVSVDHACLLKLCICSVIWMGYFPSILLQSMVGFLSLFFFFFFLRKETLDIHTGCLSPWWSSAHFPVSIILQNGS